MQTNENQELVEHPKRSIDEYREKIQSILQSINQDMPSLYRSCNIDDMLLHRVLVGNERLTVEFHSEITSTIDYLLERHISSIREVESSDPDDNVETNIPDELLLLIKQFPLELIVDNSNLRVHKGILWHCANPHIYLIEQTLPFFGRESEVRKTRKALESSQTPFVILRGPSGSGKNAIAGAALYSMNTQVSTLFSAGRASYDFRRHPSTREFAYSIIKSFLIDGAKVGDPKKRVKELFSMVRPFVLLKGCEYAENLDEVIELIKGCPTLILTSSIKIPECSDAESVIDVSELDEETTKEIVLYYGDTQIDLDLTQAAEHIKLSPFIAKLAGIYINGQYFFVNTIGTP